MADIRFLSKEKLDDAAQLADSIFRDQEHPSMAFAFPQIFSGDYGQSLGAFVEGKLVSFIGIVPQWIRIGNARLQVFSIGSVCTHPDYRSQGLAGQILERAAEHMNRSGASLMLVSGDRSLYLRFGCFKFGEAVRYEITPHDAKRIMQHHSPSAGTQFRQVQPTDLFNLHRLMELKTHSYEQGLYETAQMIHREAYAGIFKLKHQVYVAEDHSGLSAYAIFALSSERSGNAVPFVVDWGGDASTAAQLIANTVIELGLPRLTLTSPWQETVIHGMFKGASSKLRKNGGTVKILNPISLWNQLLPHLREKDSSVANVLKIDHSDEYIHLSIAGETSTLTAENFTALVFDPNWDIPALNERKELFDKLFPIAFPYTEGLNYT